MQWLGSMVAEMFSLKKMPNRFLEYHRILHTYQQRVSDIASWYLYHHLVFFSHSLIGFFFFFLFTVEF